VDVPLTDPGSEPCRSASLELQNCMHNLRNLEEGTSLIAQ